MAAPIHLSPFAVELSALSGKELDGLTAYLDDAPPLPFTYLSVHGPTKELTLDEDILAMRLCDLPPAVGLLAELISGTKFEI